MNQHELVDDAHRLRTSILRGINLDEQPAVWRTRARNVYVHQEKLIGVAVVKPDSSSTHVGCLARFVAILLSQELFRSETSLSDVMEGARNIHVS